MIDWRHRFVFFCFFVAVASISCLPRVELSITWTNIVFISNLSNAHTQNIDLKYIYIYSDKLWLHWMVFELFFYNVTIKYISKIPDGQYLAE